MTMKSLSRQVGGKHYQNEGIEPAEYIIKNKLPFAEGNAIKYISRHNDKGGKDDLLKAVHYIEMILEDSYGVGLDGEILETVECTKEHSPPTKTITFEGFNTDEMLQIKMALNGMGIDLRGTPGEGDSITITIESPIEEDFDWRAVQNDYEDMKEYCQS